ncbi:hypothetical protein [Dyadobacter sandarakinus]|uniref:ACT domain-containing protein n=1 Tax=Dyadobacter sandarakinus TaxID=2747268 RepID=A0ABX7I528_9BACT|nr:hypothetical protein [Dyadobacter sandarakinus]QRR00975.1 hypothetical protein HWI92_08715 [Dyadobacter sandarakinus]
MKDIFLLRVIYRNGLSLYNITTTVESVNGAKIQHLNLISKGRDFVGTISVEVANILDFDQIVRLIKRNQDISRVEKVTRY